MGKGPGEQVVILGLHNDHIQRDVSATPSSIAVQVCPEADPVPVGTRVEWRAVQRQRPPHPCLSHPPREVVHLPHVDAACGLHFQYLDLEVELFQDRVVARDGRGDTVDIGAHLCYRALVLLHVSDQLRHDLVQL